LSPSLGALGRSLFATWHAPVYLPVKGLEEETSFALEQKISDLVLKFWLCWALI
jgi:hypothetical protein